MADIQYRRRSHPKPARHPLGLSAPSNADQTDHQPTPRICAVPNLRHTVSALSLPSLSPSVASADGLHDKYVQKKRKGKVGPATTSAHTNTRCPRHAVFPLCQQSTANRQTCLKLYGGGENRVHKFRYKNRSRMRMCSPQCRPDTESEEQQIVVIMEKTAAWAWQKHLGWACSCLSMPVRDPYT